MYFNKSRACDVGCRMFYIFILDLCKSFFPISRVTESLLFCIMSLNNMYFGAAPNLSYVQHVD